MQGNARADSEIHNADGNIFYWTTNSIGLSDILQLWKI